MNPVDWFKEAAAGFFYHEILPVVLLVIALLTLVFAPMRWVLKFIIAVLLVAAALWLWGYFVIPGVTTP